MEKDVKPLEAEGCYVPMDSKIVQGINSGCRGQQREMARQGGWGNFALVAETVVAKVEAETDRFFAPAI